MPATSPDRISDSVSLSDKVGREERPLVSEECAVDAWLSAVADEVSPNKSGISGCCSEDDLFARSRKQTAHPPVPILVGRVMPFIQGKNGSISVSGDPPVCNQLALLVSKLRAKALSIVLLAQRALGR